MSNRRRRQQNDVDGLFGGSILAAMLLATYFQTRSSPVSRAPVLPPYR